MLEARAGAKRRRTGICNARLPRVDANGRAAADGRRRAGCGRRSINSPAWESGRPCADDGADGGCCSSSNSLQVRNQHASSPGARGPGKVGMRDIFFARLHRSGYRACGESSGQPAPRPRRDDRLDPMPVVIPSTCASATCKSIYRHWQQHGRWHNALSRVAGRSSILPMQPGTTQFP